MSARSFVAAATLLVYAGCTPAPATETAKPLPAPSVSVSAGPAPSAVAPSGQAIAAPESAPDASAGAAGGKVPDIEYVPTPENVVAKMLEVAKVSKNDIVYDLGCGDGRIIVTAAKKLGARGFGFDVDPVRVKESRENAKKAGVEHLVTIEQRDIFTVDLSPATVVTLYLLPELNVRLVPQLEKLKPGSRIVSHDFDMAGVEPEKWWTVIAKDHRDKNADREHYVYLWKTPLKKAKP
jgi:SAM-dependent methyltransferase